MLCNPWGVCNPQHTHSSRLLAFRGTDQVSPRLLQSDLHNWRSPKRICMETILAGAIEKKNPWRRKTHSAAVKIWLELVQIAFMGHSCPFISPMGAKVSTFQSLRVPPLQPLSRTGTPGTRPRAHTQSLWAFGTCWKREGRPSLTGLHEILGTSAQTEWSHVLSLIPALQCICYVTRCITAPQLLLL